MNPEQSYIKYAGLRDERGETDYQVAAATDIGRSTFSDWKSGRSQPKIGKLTRIARHFDVPLEFFTDGGAK